MAPELLNSLDTVELKDLAGRVLEYQEGKGLSDSAMLRKFAALGSTTTYKNILNGKLAELDLEKWLTNYRSVVALIESSKDDEEDEEIYADMVGPLELKRAFMETSTTKSIARFVLVQGDTGTGKSFCLKSLMAKFGMLRILKVEATVVWGDRPRAFICAVLTTLGVKEHPAAEADCLIKLIEKLKETRRAILVDEGHHLGPRCLNTIKTIINQTAGEVIVFAMKTLWSRLERGAYEECRQLTGNRLAERIQLELNDRDIALYLERKLRMKSADIKTAMKTVLEQAPTRGNFGFIREVAKRARDQADGEQVTWEILNNAMTAEKKRR